MTDRFYSEETEQQERARRRNEVRRAFSSMFINSGIALLAAAVASLYNNHANPDPTVVWWLLFTFGLICSALYILGRVEPEF